MYVCVCAHGTCKSWRGARSRGEILDDLRFVENEIEYCERRERNEPVAAGI